MIDNRINVDVVIPTIPPREQMLARAWRSVQRQTLAPRGIWVCRDTERQGPARLRNAGVAESPAEWIAFLDDDDEFLPEHLEILWGATLDTGADVIHPWFRVEGGTDPFPQNRGRQWTPEDPFPIPITTLIRREAFLDVGGFVPVDVAAPDPNDPDRLVSNEDWRLWTMLGAAGARFHHVDVETWIWHHHASNTSGLTDRW